MGSSAEQVTQLRQYSACDISDALLKLKVPGAGFVADLNLYSPPAGDPGSVTVAPVSTVLFAAKGQDLAEPVSNIPKGVHWADLTIPGTIVVLKQQEGQKNAICGGIMAVRMKVCQAEGIIVAGRARDIGELKSTALPVSAPLPTHRILPRSPVRSPETFCRFGPVDSPPSALGAAVSPGPRKCRWTLTEPSSRRETWPLAIQSTGSSSYRRTRSPTCWNCFRG